MKKIITIFFAGIITVQNISAQNIFPATGSAGIGTAAPNASSLLEMTSTTKGLLIPRMTVAQRNAIASPATGLMIFQTNNTPGFYYYSGTAWNAVSPKSANQTLSNLTAPTAVNQILQPNVTGAIDLGSPGFKWKDIYFFGTLINGAGTIMKMTGDNTALGTNALFSNSGIGNTATGYNALLLNTSAERNTANGFKALYNNTTGSYNAALGSEALYANTTGYFNTANGFYALNKNTTGDRNTANGSYSMYNNTTGRLNTATGVDALYSNTTGSANVANGFESLHNNTTGSANIAIGTGALYSNTTISNLVAIGDSALFNNGIGTSTIYQGVINTGIGSKALFKNTTGTGNTAIGFESMKSNMNGLGNTASGDQSLFSNISGIYNNAFGEGAMYDNTTGIYNAAVGAYSLSSNISGSANTAVGYHALDYNRTGYGNTAIGSGADIIADDYYNATAIGYGAIATFNNEIMLGNTDVNSVVAAGSYVIYSDGRFKKNIKENVPGLEFIKQLRPVTYNYDIHKLNDYIKPDRKAKDIMEENADFKKRKEYAIINKEKITYTGFVAQEVEKIADKMGYDFSGVHKPQNDKDPYGLSYADFVVPLVKAVQELSKANDALQQQNTDLEKRMQQLEAMMNVQSSATGNAQTVKIISVALEQNIPNPFNHSTTINYTLPQQCSNAKIVITDNAGKSLKEINITGKIKGSVTVDASSLSSGTYYYSLYADGKMISSKQMVLAK